MILAVLQARYSSSRLPGKVLRPILGKPMVLLQIERIRHAHKIDQLVLATSEDISDNPIADMCMNNGIECFRGSLSDVLDRYYYAAVKYQPDHVVRLTGDCPLADPFLIDRVIEYHLDGEYDYTSNVTQQTFPDGLDIEVMKFGTLTKAWREAKMASQREHVTLFINQQPDLFNIGTVKNDQDLSSLRWTVDEPLDFCLVETIYQNLYPTNPEFSTNDILNFLDAYPELKTINTGYVRNEGLIKSLSQDKNVK